MGSRRLFKSVARGVAEAFVSRNNDLDGWWAPGLLRRFANSPGFSFRIDLLTGEMATSDDGPVPLYRNSLMSLGPAYARYFRWSAERHGAPLAPVQAASLWLVFELGRFVNSWIPGEQDEPFRVEVAITDDRGRRFVATAASHCSDPDTLPRGLLRRSVVTATPRILARLNEPT
jgi:hypothetical protein